MSRDIEARSTRLLRWAWILPILCITVGCHEVGISRPWFRSAIRSRVESFASTHDLSELVETTLRRKGLLDRSKNDPASVVALLETQFGSADDPLHLLSLAELSLRIGYQTRSHRPAEAMGRFRDAAVYSVWSLHDIAPELGQVELAIALHNQSLSALLPLIMAESARSKRPWTHIATQLGLKLDTPTPYLSPERFNDIQLATDYRTTGVQVSFHNDGLGVPLVALRAVTRDRPIEPGDRYLPRRLYVAATAVIGPPQAPLTRDWRSQSFNLTFFDPFCERYLTTGRRRFPLATDRSTPLAVQVSQGKFSVIAMNGLFNASKAESGAGLYMFRPYQPGKIPIVLVHGLFSTPAAWDQTINELQNDPEIDAHYQIWFFLYPTGNIVPQSAATLRRTLRESVATLDPAGADPSLRRMVVVGHSMGGLLAKMMAQDTGTRFWDAILSIPTDLFEASTKTRELFSASLIYERLPFVERLVFIATPHRGSRWGTRILGRLVSRFIQPQSSLAEASKELFTRYGQKVAIAEFRQKRVTSIGNLAYHDPILMAIDSLPIHPSVPFHSIIMKIPGTETDGVVSYGSAHLAGAASEQLISGTHVDQELPAVTSELKRILREHLADRSH